MNDLITKKIRDIVYAVAEYGANDAHEGHGLQRNKDFDEIAPLEAIDQINKLISEAIEAHDKEVREKIEAMKVNYPASVYAVPGGRVRETFNTAYNQALEDVLALLEEKK